MKKLLVALGLIALLCNSALATTFSHVCSTGQTLYYEITSTNTVRVIPSHNYTSSYWGQHLYPSGMDPKGRLEIPSQVWSFIHGSFTVTEIGDYAFYCCDSLEIVYVPSTVISVGDRSFEQCVNLRIVHLPSSVTSIGDFAFSNCDTLSNISFSGVTSIGWDAFWGCRNLTSVSLPNGITEINGYTFSFCSNLQTINLPASLNRIKNHAFYGCSNLQTIQIPSNVTDIWGFAFKDCTSLAMVSFGEDSRLSYLESCVFSGCTNLHSIYLPDSLQEIPNYAFLNQTSLEKIVIGQSVNLIGEEAFLGCINLDTIIAKPINAPSLSLSVFDSTPGNKIVIVPCPSNYATIWGTTGFSYSFNREYTLSLLPNNPLWGNANIIQELGCDTTVILATAFENCVFLHWSDGDTTNPRTVITTSDESYTAFFAKQFYNVTVEANDSTMGTAIGNGTYAAGAVVSLTAAPKSGYFFDSWNDGNIDNPRTIIPVDDTTIIAIFSDIHDSVWIHDTTVVNIQIHDTTTLNVHDTTYIYVPYTVHDTTIMTDTVTLTEYIPVHDTTYITQTDTLMQYDTITNIVFDTIDNFVHDTLTITDTLWLTQYDTLWLHDTIIIHDTIYITQEGIDGVDALNAKVYSSQGQIVVECADGNTVWLYDINGRVLATKQDDYTPLRFDVPVSGTYIIKIGLFPARKVVVIR